VLLLPCGVRATQSNDNYVEKQCDRWTTNAEEASTLVSRNVDALRIYYFELATPLS
jgi:hypothetical protein